MAGRLRMAAIPNITTISGMAGMYGMAKTNYNRYKGWTDFIIKLVVVNSNSSSLTQIVN
jgi:hypothetical protein